MMSIEALELAKNILDADIYNENVFGAAMKLSRYVIERETPIVPANQRESIGQGGVRVGECLRSCGWLVLTREKFCSNCGRPLDWDHAGK